MSYSSCSIIKDSVQLGTRAYRYYRNESVLYLIFDEYLKKTTIYQRIVRPLLFYVGYSLVEKCFVIPISRMVSRSILKQCLEGDAFGKNINWRNLENCNKIFLLALKTWVFTVSVAFKAINMSLYYVAPSIKEMSLQTMNYCISPVVERMIQTNTKKTFRLFYNLAFDIVIMNVGLQLLHNHLSIFFGQKSRLSFPSFSRKTYLCYLGFLGAKVSYKSIWHLYYRQAVKKDFLYLLQVRLFGDLFVHSHFKQLISPYLSKICIPAFISTRITSIAYRSIEEGMMAQLIKNKSKS